MQMAVVTEEADGRDLLVSAQTGSGKTIAFGLALADTILEGAQSMAPAGDPLALIIAPTRELAMQVQRELSWLYHYAGARIVSCVGGMDPGAERRELARGAHIVVGTPGRLRDHLERRALKVSALKAAVLDEADEMLDMGFRADLQFILETTPAERRTLLFSATLPKAIVTLAQHYQKDALRIATRSDVAGHADIEYRAIRIAGNKIERAVVNLLRFMDPPSALVFCNTRNAVRHMEAQLTERGFDAAGTARWPRPGLRRHRRGGAGHRFAQPKPCHPCRPAQRCPGAAASERPYGARRQEGRQCPAGAAGPPPPCRGNAGPRPRPGHMGQCAFCR